MDLKTLVKFAKRHGWTVTYNASRHPEFWAPGADPKGRPTATGSGTPSDHRAMNNLVGELRRNGLPVPHRGRTPKKRK